MHGYPDKMTPEQARTFRDDVLNIVSQIPRGRVTTYGHIAALTGWPSHSRMVGRTLRYTPGAEELPCHRVVNKEGRTAPGWSRQRPLLEYLRCIAITHCLVGCSGLFDLLKKTFGCLTV